MKTFNQLSIAQRLTLITLAKNPILPKTCSEIVSLRANTFPNTTAKSPGSISASLRVLEKSFLVRSNKQGRQTRWIITQEGRYAAGEYV